jgi:dihydrofolate reductase
MTTLYMAISADGFIADSHDKTPWSDDEWKAFQVFVKTCDIVLLGRRTYEIMRKQGEFITGPEYIVVTSNSTLNAGNFHKLSIEHERDMPKAKKIGIIGGGELNGSLAKLGVIDEIILDVEPIILGSGKRLFGSHDMQLNLALLESSKLGSATVQNRYKVLK